LSVPRITIEECLAKGNEMRNQIAVQRHNLEVKAQADGLTVGLLAVLKIVSCDESQPESMWCYALDRVIEDKAKDFASSTGNLFLNALLY
jgi:hypothetical protein